MKQIKKAEYISVLKDLFNNFKVPDASFKIKIILGTAALLLSILITLLKVAIR